MKTLEIELEKLKDIYDYITEGIIIVDKDFNIVVANNKVLEQLDIKEDDLLYTSISKYIPLEFHEEILTTIKNNDDRYFDVMIRKTSNDIFPAHLSGQVLTIGTENYGILTIVDITDIKAKEEDQLRKLKSHIITQATGYVQKENEIKDQKYSEISYLQDQLAKSEHEKFKLEKKVDLFERENKLLNKQLEKVADDYFSFEQLLLREIAISKRYDRKFSLAIVSIDDYNTFANKVETESKKELILRALKKHFKSTIRSSDLIYYESAGLFYLILTNSSEINITDLVNRLASSKKVDQSFVIEFNTGVAHFHENDNLDHLMYRARKNLDFNTKQKDIQKTVRRKMGKA